jgi:carboxylesterase type B
MFGTEPPSLESFSRMAAPAASRSSITTTRARGQVSEVMQGYFANFIKTGDANGGALPKWVAANSGSAMQRMRIDVEPRLEPDAYAALSSARKNLFEVALQVLSPVPPVVDSSVRQKQR